jgi:hypothetical protein
VRSAAAAAARVSEPEEAAAAASAAATEARRACADAVIRRVLDALEAAQRERLVHCDVRPDNIVVAGGAPLLADWGCACAAGTHIQGRGVAAFASTRVFVGTGVAATSSVDAAAALYTWLAIACGDGCVPPWMCRGNSVERLLAERRRWLEDAAADGDARVAAVVHAVGELDAARGGGLDALAVARQSLAP